MDEEITGDEEDIELDEWVRLLFLEERGELTEEEAAILARQRAIYAKRQEKNAG